MKFKYFFITLLTLFFCTTACAATIAKKSPTTAANQLAALLTVYKTYTANFKQITYSGQSQQSSFGKFYLQRPGKFRWEVKQPNQQIIIANGKTLWVYEVALQQVTKQKIDMQSANNPAVLLSGNVKELIKHYHVSKVQNRGNIWYELKPRSTKSSFLLVRLRFVKNRLVAVWVKNNLGQITDFKFFNIKLNIRLKATLFDFKPPPGVDVLQ